MVSNLFLYGVTVQPGNRGLETAGCRGERERDSYILTEYRRYVDTQDFEYLQTKIHFNTFDTVSLDQSFASPSPRLQLPGATEPENDFFVCVGIYYICNEQSSLVRAAFDLLQCNTILY